LHTVGHDTMRGVHPRPARFRPFVTLRTGAL
jgi:hypothetical protein